MIKRIRIALLLCLGLITAAMAGIWLYSARSIRSIDEKAGADHGYSRHYLMITEENSSLTSRICEAASGEAARTDACLEWLHPGQDADYTLTECMEIARASGVDGIILMPDGEDLLPERIREAVRSNIPVVTIVDDVPDSGRISFVGINSYQMGEVYGREILKLMKPGKNRIRLLMNASDETVSVNLQNARLREVLEKGKEPGQEIELDSLQINMNTAYEAEEAIRDLFLSSEDLPDILVCMDVKTTESVCQAIVDYNKVGSVNIIGYYASESILDALEKGILPVTIGLKAEEIGRYGVEALNDYLEQGYASDYLSVGLEVLTSDTEAGQTGKEGEEALP